MKSNSDKKNDFQSVIESFVKSKYKWWLVSLATLSLVCAAVFIFITKSGLAEVLLMGMFVSLLINLIASLVTIILVEERDQRFIQQLETTRQSIVIEKLIRAIRNYNELFANLYKATFIPSIDSIQELEQRSANIYFEMDNFVQHLNRLDFTQEGYIMRYSSEMFDPSVKLHSLTWLECFIDITKKYISTIQSIQDSYLFIITNTAIINPLKQISGHYDELSKFSWDSNWYKLVPNMLEPKELGKSSFYPDGIELKRIYNMLYTMDTIWDTLGLMTEIDKITNKKNFAIPPYVFTAFGTSPVIGSAIDEKYIRYYR